MPVRGGSAQVTPEELAKYQPAYHVHFRIFDLAKPDDIVAYETLMSAAASLPWIKVLKEVQPTEGPDVWKIGVKWFEVYLQPQLTGIFRAPDSPLG